jgi:ABC-2 type transport system ATP-binding protein
VNQSGFMIETQNLGKTFAPPAWPISLAARRSARAARALHAVNLRVERGEIFGLMGPNGAGKTTLLRVLATLVIPSEGWARVSGADVVHDGDAVRRAIGLAAGEQRGFYWRLNGLENMEFFAGLLGLAPAAARRRAEHVLEIVDLLPYARESVEYYSTGMRQRLGIARALLSSPRVLLLDEPTRSLDQYATQRTHDLIRHLAEETGVTVLLATHHPAEAAALCDRAAILVDGSVLETVHLSDTNEAAMAAKYRSVIGAA